MLFRSLACRPAPDAAPPKRRRPLRGPPAPLDAKPMAPVLVLVLTLAITPARALEVAPAPNLVPAEKWLESPGLSQSSLPLLGGCKPTPSKSAAPIKQPPRFCQNSSFFSQTVLLFFNGFSLCHIVNAYEKCKHRISVGPIILSWRFFVQYLYQMQYNTFLV